MVLDCAAASLFICLSLSFALHSHINSHDLVLGGLVEIAVGNVDLALLDHLVQLDDVLVDRLAKREPFDEHFRTAEKEQVTFMEG